jgi:hypothetical protein
MIRCLRDLREARMLSTAHAGTFIAAEHPSQLSCG